MTIHHHRDRKTGPCFPLAVAQCRPHKVVFTVYPPGHFPYGRSAFAPVESDGSPRRSAPKPTPPPTDPPADPPAEPPTTPPTQPPVEPPVEPPAEPPSGLAGGNEARKGAHSVSTSHAFSNTIFDAALDAAQGVRWRFAEQLDGSPDGTDRWWSTQQRHLARAMQLVGVAPGLSDNHRHEVAELLSVETLVLNEAVNELLAGSSGYVACGKAVVKVLECLPHSAYLPERIAQCGFLACLWTEPLRWDPRRELLLQKPFQPLRTRGPPPAG